jgi:hypothetical protein
MQKSLKALVHVSLKNLNENVVPHLRFGQVLFEVKGRTCVQCPDLSDIGSH